MIKFFNVNPHDTGIEHVKKKKIDILINREAKIATQTDVKNFIKSEMARDLSATPSLLKKIFLRELRQVSVISQVH